MAGNLESVLAKIPFYGGYMAKRQADEQQTLGELHQATGVQGLLASIQQQQDATKLRETLAASGGDVEKALAGALQSGNVKAAHELAPLAKLAQERRSAEATTEGLQALNARYSPQGAAPDQPQELGVGQPIAQAGDQPQAPPNAQDARQRRVEYLTQLSSMPKYANNPIVQQRIQAELDKLSAVKPMIEHNFSIGGDQVQPHISYDEGRSWNPIPGSKPSAKFAKQVVSVNAPSKEELSREAVRDLAIQSLYDPNATAGYRRDTTAMSRIANERLKVMKEGGITSEDVVSGRAGFKADTISLNKMVPQYDAITAFEQTAIRNGKVLMQLADKVDTTGAPVLERWIRAGRQEVAGDVDVSKFNAQMHLYRAEAARILTQPALTGVLSDSARHEMESFLKGNASANQIRGVVNLLETDFDRRKQTLEEQIGSIRARMRGRVAPGGGGTPPAAPAPVPSPAPAGAGWSITPVKPGG